MKAIQIGVVGSYSDLKYSKKLNPLAQALGFFIGQAKAILVVGGEQDGGLTEMVVRGAKKTNGFVIGIMPNKNNASPNIDFIIQTGGFYGLREYLIAISCDVLISINGGSGTLNEITVAYQNKIPVVVMGTTGGWSTKLANTYLDKRKKYKFFSADTPLAAVKKALSLAKRKDNYGK